MPPKKTLNSSPKLSHRTLGKSFDFSSDKDVDEEKDISEDDLCNRTVNEIAVLKKNRRNSP